MVNMLYVFILHIAYTDFYLYVIIINWISTLTQQLQAPSTSCDVLHYMQQLQRIGDLGDPVILGEFLHQFVKTWGKPPQTYR